MSKGGQRQENYCYAVVFNGNSTVHEKKWQAGFKLSKTLPHLIKSALNTIYILVSKQVLESYYQKMRQIIFFRVLCGNSMPKRFKVHSLTGRINRKVMEKAFKNVKRNKGV